MFEYESAILFANNLTIDTALDKSAILITGLCSFCKVLSWYAVLTGLTALVKLV